MYRTLALLLPLFMMAPLALAGEAPAALSARLAKLVPGLAPDSVEPSPVAGVYQVMFGPQVLNISADGRYLLRGDIVDFKTEENITETVRSGARIKAVNELGEDSMIVFSPDKATYTLTVFTDTDCIYCQKLHRDVPELNRAGIKVRYLAFPRTEQSFRELVSVWCADDPVKAMSAAKAGESVEVRTCENPVKKHYSVGRMIGVKGTPYMLLESGTELPGHVPPKELIKLIRDEQGS